MTDHPKREQVLDAAKKAVTSDRNSSYGEPGDNLDRIARLWSVLFGHEVTPSQVALAMVLTKTARLIHADSEDSWVDIAGYAAIGAEVSNDG